MSSLLSRAITIRQWIDDPPQFFRDVTGLEPSVQQKEIMMWAKRPTNGKLILVAGTGSGKSVTPDTIVPVIIDNELHTVPIGDLDNIGNASTFSVDKYGNVSELPIRHLIKLEHHGKIYNIKTNTGRTIRVTPDHGLLTFSNGKIERINASDVSVGTLMPIAETMRLPVKNYKVNIDNKEIDLDWNFGFLIGFYLAEGSIGNGRNGLPSFISLTNKDSMSRETLTNVTKKTLDYDIKHYIDKRNGVYNSTIINASFARFIGDNFYKTHNKHIAEWAYLTPLEFRRGLLSGYFSGDGEFNEGNVDCTSVSKMLRDGIGLLLSSVGVTYTLTDRIIDGVKYYRLSVGKPTLGLFMNNIKVCDSTKLDKVNTNHSGQDYRLIPLDSSSRYLIRGLSRSEYSNHPINTEIKRGYAGKRTLQNQVNELDKDYSWLHSDVFFDKIISIEEEDYDGWVYDFDTGDNTFCTVNGLFVHNTFCLAVLALWFVICMPFMTGKPIKIAIASGSREQAGRVYDYIVQFCNFNKTLSDWIKGKPLKSQVNFKDSSWIAPMAASSQQLYNLHADVYVIDEAAVAGDEVIEHAPRIVGSSYPNKIIISGHFIDDPKVYISKFADIWQNTDEYPEEGTTGDPDMEWKRIHFTSMDVPWVSASEIETARRMYSKEKFDAVFKGMLPELTTSLFNLTHIRNMRNDTEPGIGAENNAKIMAVDWGFKGDPTAILIVEIIAAKNPLDNQYNVLYAKEYSQKTGPQMQEEIDRLYTSYRCSEVRCDSSHSQENYRLRFRGMQVREMVFKAIKSRMQERLRVLVEREHLIIWKGFEDLLKELVAYTLEAKGDDHLVDCMMMATYIKNDHTYGNVFVVKKKYGRANRDKKEEEKTIEQLEAVLDAQ